MPKGSRVAQVSSFGLQEGSFCTVPRKLAMMIFGRRADQGDQTTKDGGKGQGHQGESGGAFGLVGGFQVNRH